MGCVLQPGEDIAVAALKPGETTSESVQPGQEIDLCPPDGPVYVLTLNDFQQDTVGADPTAFGSMVAGYNPQNSGIVFRFFEEDSNNNNPTLQQFFGVTNWVDNKAVAGIGSSEIIYCRFQQTGGSGVLGFGSSPMNTWLRMSGPAPETNLVLLVTPAGTAFDDWQGTCEISRDQVIIEDQCTISLSNTQTGP